MQIKHSAPKGIIIYYWPCSLILLAPSLLLDRPTSPLCATLRIACGKPYSIEVNGQKLVTRASLVAPGAVRNQLIAFESDIALFYIPVEAAGMKQVKALLKNRDVVDFAIDRFEHLLPTIRLAASGELRPAQARQLMDDVIESMLGEPIQEKSPVDPRIERVLNALATLPLNEVEADVLAREAHLSKSRLRYLFKKEVGFTVQQYARWLAVWRGCLMWQRGRQFTEVAMDAGFHDLSHVDHAFNEVFGINPTNVIDPNFVSLIHCAPDAAS